MSTKYRFTGRVVSMMNAATGEELPGVRLVDEPCTVDEQDHVYFHGKCAGKGAFRELCLGTLIPSEVAAFAAGRGLRFS